MSNNKLKWYENAGFITILIIAVIIFAIIISQSYAVTSGGFTSLSSVLNHNSMYFFLLIYFVFLNIPLGKKYFDYLNIFLIFIYLIYSITSFLTLMQSFNLITVIDFLINAILTIYLFHTMFRKTRIWDDLNLGYSPFNEISNDNYFSVIVILIVVNLSVNLISTVVIDGLFISVLDSLYLLLFSRYIYLYREYLDYGKEVSQKKVDEDNIENKEEEKKKSTTRKYTSRKKKTKKEGDDK